MNKLRKVTKGNQNLSSTSSSATPISSTSSPSPTKTCNSQSTAGIYYSPQRNDSSLSQTQTPSFKSTFSSPYDSRNVVATISSRSASSSLISTRPPLRSAGSRDEQRAVTTYTSPSGTTTTLGSSSSSSWRMPYISNNFHPRSRIEQYWAARALSAETLLAARMEHHRDLRSLTVGEEGKRARELAELRKANDEKIAKLEKLVLILLTIFLTFTCVLFVAYTYVTSTNHQRYTRTKQAYSHFTIPILSPFASVVEHEVSVIGTKTITALCVIFSALAYFMMRYWVSRSQAGTLGRSGTG